jgi:prepilin-type processing-associated H-X9-DG protein
MANKIKWQKRLVRWILIISFAVGLAVVTIFILPSFVDHKVPRHILCLANLGKIGKALYSYKHDHHDQFPPNLESLLDPRYLDSKKYLICPFIDKNSKDTSYAYRGSNLKENLIPELIMAYDKLPHPIKIPSRNVLFLDGHVVERMTEENFQKEIQKDNEIRRSRGLPEIPAE